MIKRIIVYLMFGFLIVALLLSFAGVHTIMGSNNFRNFLVSVNNSYNQWNVEIPDIPKVVAKSLEQNNSGSEILGVLKRIAKFLIDVFNGLIGLVNFVVMIVNLLINIVQFLITFIFQFKDFINISKNGVLSLTKCEKTFSSFWGGGFSSFRI